MTDEVGTKRNWISQLCLLGHSHEKICQSRESLSCLVCLTDKPLETAWAVPHLLPGPAGDALDHPCLSLLIHKGSKKGIVLGVFAKTPPLVPEIFCLMFLSSTSRCLCGGAVSRWRCCVEVEVLKGRYCVEVYMLCQCGGAVMKWSRCVDVEVLWWNGGAVSM